MNSTKRKKLENAGWKVGSATEFLGLTPEEEVLVEIKLMLSKKVKELRQKLGLTQVEAAKRLNSSQSRIAKIEACDKSVSMELLMRSMASLGASRKDIGTAISRKDRQAKKRSAKTAKGKSTHKKSRASTKAA